MTRERPNPAWRGGARVETCGGQWTAARCAGGAARGARPLGLWEMMGPNSTLLLRATRNTETQSGRRRSPARYSTTSPLVRNFRATAAPCRAPRPSASSASSARPAPTPPAPPSARRSTPRPGLVIAARAATRLAVASRRRQPPSNTRFWRRLRHARALHPELRGAACARGAAGRAEGAAAQIEARPRTRREAHRSAGAAEGKFGEPCVSPALLWPPRVPSRRRAPLTPRTAVQSRRKNVGALRLVLAPRRPPPRHPVRARLHLARQGPLGRPARLRRDGGRVSAGHPCRLPASGAASTACASTDAPRPTPISSRRATNSSTSSSARSRACPIRRSPSSTTPTASCPRQAGGHPGAPRRPIPAEYGGRNSAGRAARACCRRRRAAKAASTSSTASISTRRACCCWRVPPSARASSRRCSTKAQSPRRTLRACAACCPPAGPPTRARRSASPPPTARRAALATLTATIAAHTALRALAADAASRTSLVLATPSTGRTHQIRLHLRHLGHPIGSAVRRRRRRRRRGGRRRAAAQARARRRRRRGRREDEQERAFVRRRRRICIDAPMPEWATVPFGRVELPAPPALRATPAPAPVASAPPPAPAPPLCAAAPAAAAPNCALASEEGARLLAECAPADRAAYDALWPCFARQRGRTACGVASTAMALRALGLGEDDEAAILQRCEGDGAALPRAKIERCGMTLAELSSSARWNRSGCAPPASTPTPPTPTRWWRRCAAPASCCSTTT